MEKLVQLSMAILLVVTLLAKWWSWYGGSIPGVVGTCDGKSLEDYFLLVPERHNFYEVAPPSQKKGVQMTGTQRLQK
jgi:hypothetical protein